MRKILKMDEDTFNDRIVDWAEEFGFHIDGQYVNFAGSDVSGFIKELNAKFAQWGQLETTGLGKVVSLTSKPLPELASKQSPMKPRMQTVGKQAGAGIKNYHGTPLFAPDYDVMQGIELQGGRTIPMVAKVSETTSGFIAKGRHVTALRLSLFENKAFSLPERIGQLKSLKEFWLTLNQLRFLPEAIEQLKSLEKLFLDHNQLTSLPDAIGQLSSLQTFNLNNNRLSSLPDTIGELQSLKELDLTNNQLTSLVRHSEVLAYS